MSRWLVQGEGKGRRFVRVVELYGIPSPPAMIVFPNAKINLGLNVIQRRPDGFHDIESVMVPIPLYDALEVIADEQLAQGEVVFCRSGSTVPGPVHDDLCWKAVQAIGALHPLPGMRMHLHKAIPMGAGLGGGSSDAAHVIRAVNSVFQLQLSSHEQHLLAGRLGSDCAFFLHNTPCLALGRGEQLQPLELDLSGVHLMLVNPGIHVSTAEVYRHTIPTGRVWGLAELLRSRPIEDWQEHVPNTMETYVMHEHPALGAIKQRMIDAGAAYASMSGSGSSVFGLFRDRPDNMSWPEGHTCWTFTL